MKTSFLILLLIILCADYSKYSAQNIVNVNIKDTSYVVVNQGGAFYKAPKSFTGNVFVYNGKHKRKNLVANYAVVGGLKYGTFFEYSEGKLNEIRSYVSDTLNGSRTVYYPSGDIRVSQSYLNGLLHGYSFMWRKIECNNNTILNSLFSIRYYEFDTVIWEKTFENECL